MEGEYKEREREKIPYYRLELHWRMRDVGEREEGRGKARKTRKDSRFEKEIAARMEGGFKKTKGSREQLRIPMTKTED